MISFAFKDLLNANEFGDTFKGQLAKLTID